MTSRKTLIFGNGLGRALDDTKFQLKDAFSTVWEDNSDDDFKSLISECTGKSSAPAEETEFDKVQQAYFACRFFKDAELRNRFLSQCAQDFPDKLGRFIHSVAKKFYLSDSKLPNDFIDALIKFIEKTNSHVATLNYDGLLYRPFCERNVLRGYNGSLVDGLTNSGFDSDNLDRMPGKSFGWYLHLHGSPIFHENEHGIITKNNATEIDLPTNARQHIVLTHHKFKLAVIEESTILSTYWRYLRLALQESDEVILFGYSGADSHLNILLNDSKKAIRIIEWKNTSISDADRKNYWYHLFPKSRPNVNRYENILQFVSWQDA